MSYLRLIPERGKCLLISVVTKVKYRTFLFYPVMSLTLCTKWILNVSPAVWSSILWLPNGAPLCKLPFQLPVRRLEIVFIVTIMEIWVQLKGKNQNSFVKIIKHGMNIDFFFFFTWHLNSVTDWYWKILFLNLVFIMAYYDNSKLLLHPLPLKTLKRWEGVSCTIEGKTRIRTRLQGILICLHATT